ncbi:Rqc2 family fibronectin-binding protein [Natranaerobius trueperi]|uniref:Rqc2 homolog RqcH n=1 Tax=Natranaerobius trueperi TaxID=759412 RepID=A0A226BZD4_9FIRM|nr:NFACT family protein [Natranaerobius trueperi]OWZ84152.1 hypothetical protein CDO51_04595 [Natranaerobius trueperi]
MPIDGFFIKGLVSELKQIENGRIDRIHQPTKNSLKIQIYSKSGKKTLLLSANSKSSSVHFTNKSMENPPTPPPFCMLLRKFLIGGKITNISQYENDRIIDFHIKRTDEFDLTKEFMLPCELTGKHSNIVIVNKGTNRILDGIKRIQRELSDEREIIPGVLFERPPKQNKLNPFDITNNELKKLLQNTSIEDDYEKIFFENFQGVSPLLSKKIVKKSGFFSTQDYNDLISYWSSTKEKLMSQNYTPILIKDEKFDEIKDIYWDKSLFDNVKTIEYSSLNDATDDYFYYKERKELTHQLQTNLKKKVNQALKKAKKKFKKQKKEYENSEEGSIYKIYGELLSANYHLLANAHSNEVSVYNFYQDPPEEISIPIDSSKTPGENIENYFNKFKKSTNRVEKLGKEIKITKNEIKYLEGLVFQIDEAKTLEELETIKLEAIQEGYIKREKTQKKKKETQKDDYIRYYSQDGYLILVGKNNKQNDSLTLKETSKNDIWLHTKEIAGSHVIIKGNNIPESTLSEAANIAAYHSKARHSENVPVDYTYVKHVRKPKGAKPGMVFYENYKTIYANPYELEQNES